MKLSHFVLHKVLGDLLDGSGWTSALVQAGVATSGTAEAFLKASHIRKTRYAHEVTAASLYILLENAYQDYHRDARGSEEEVPSMEEWASTRSDECPQFGYWLKVLSLELHMFAFVCSIREGNFSLYVESLTKIAPWMFAMNHTNYARWLPVHIRDITTLSEKHPDVLKEFRAGKFVVQKTQSRFSAMAIDQCHEQNNALIKGSGEAVGLTENPAALRRWMLAGPEVSRIVHEFEDTIRISASQEGPHHDQRHGTQTAFMTNVRSFVSTVEEMGNPFLEDSKELLSLDTRDIMSASVIECLKSLEKTGKSQCKKYVEERLVLCTKPITDPLPRNKLFLFTTPVTRPNSKQKEQLLAVRNDCNLFSRLYIACQTRDGDLENFFAHENQASPPSLSLGGRLRFGTKSDLLQCLEKEQETPQTTTFDAIFLDGAAVVQMLKPGTAGTFQVCRHSVCAICFVATSIINQSGSRLGCLSGI